MSQTLTDMVKRLGQNPLCREEFELESVSILNGVDVELNEVPLVYGIYIETYSGAGISDQTFFDHVSVQKCSVTYRCTQVLP